jgi:hypothetical protein
LQQQQPQHRALLQQSPCLPAAARLPAFAPSPFRPSVLAAAAQLQQKVSAAVLQQSLAAKNGQRQQQQQQQQLGSPDSCPESAIPDSQLQQLSPDEVTGPARTTLQQQQQQPTPQSRQHRLSPSGHAKQPSWQRQKGLDPALGKVLAGQVVPMPRVGDRLLCNRPTSNNELQPFRIEIQCESTRLND